MKIPGLLQAKGDIMVQAIVNIGEYEDRILTIVKGKFGFKNKSEAINFVIDKYEEEFLEPELKPEFVKKILSIKKSKGKTYKSMAQLRKDIENEWIWDKARITKETD